MKRKISVLLGLFGLSAIALFGYYRWQNRLPVAQPEDIAAFIEKDRLAEGDQLILDSLRVFLQEEKADAAEALFARHHFRFRRIFHYLMRRTLYAIYTGDEVPETTAWRPIANWLATQFAGQFQEPMYFSELAFYDRLTPSEQVYKLSLEIFYQQGQQSLLSDTAGAANAYRQSLRLSRHIGDRRREVDNLLKLKYLAYVGGDYTVAVRLARATLEKAQAYGYRYREVWARHALGSALFFLGEYAEAARHLKQGLALAHRLQDELAISNILERLSIAARRMGDFQTALSSLDEAMQLARKNNSQYDILIGYINYGLLYRGMGDYDRAMRYYQKAYDLAGKLNSPENVALSLLDMGYLHRVLGQFNRARAKLLQALDIYIGLKDAYRIATTLKNIGDLHFEEQADSVALIYYRRALNELRNAVPEDQQKAANRIEGEIRLGIGNYFLRQGEWRRAVQEFQRMRDVFKQKGYMAGVIQASLRLADSYAQMGDPKSPIGWYDEAIELAEKMQDPELLYNAYYSRGRFHMNQQNEALAEQDYLAAIRIIEHTRRRLSTDPKMSYFATVQDVYDDMIRLQLRRGRVEDAFAYSERARARALYDLLQPSGTDTAGPPAFESDIDFRALLAASGNGIQVVEYKLTRDGMIIFVLDERKIQAFHVPIPGDSLRANIAAFLQSIGAQDPDAFRESVRKRPKATFSRSVLLGRRLFQVLVEPVRTALRTDRVLYIIPDDILMYLPFSALSLPESTVDAPRFWLHETVLAYAPSVSVLWRQFKQRMRQNGSAEPPRLLAVGNPTGDLKGAEAEVRQIAALFQDAEVLIGEQSSEARFRDRVDKRYDVLHLATHATANQDNAWGSYLLLGPRSSRSPVYRSADTPSVDLGDDVLTVDEIMELDFRNVQLVTLSACETGGGRIYRGEGVFGLTQAFIRGGVPTIVTSLWKQDDKYTRFLMVRFYQNWQAGEPFARALRQAQLTLIDTMLADPIVQYPYPFAWAGFIVVGSYR